MQWFFRSLKFCFSSHVVLDQSSSYSYSSAWQVHRLMQLIELWCFCLHSITCNSTQHRHNRNFPTNQCVTLKRPFKSPEPVQPWWWWWWGLAKCTVYHYRRYKIYTILWHRKHHGQDVSISSESSHGYLFLCGTYAHVGQNASASHFPRSVSHTLFCIHYLNIFHLGLTSTSFTLRMYTNLCCAVSMSCVLVWWLNLHLAFPFEVLFR